MIVARFLGTAGFQGLLLPGKADVTVRRFPVSLWEEQVADSVDIEVIVARGLTMGGEPVTAWFGEDLLSDAQAVVSGENGALIGSRQAADLAAVPVSVDAESRLRINVQLKPGVTAFGELAPETC